MVVDAAMLVVGDQQKCALPLGTFGQDVVHLGDEPFAAVNGKIGVLAAGKVSVVIVVVLRFDEGVCREIAVECMRLKLGVVVGKLSLCCTRYLLAIRIDAPEV